MSSGQGKWRRLVTHERREQLLRASRERAREQRRQALRRAGVVSAVDLGLDEVRQRFEEHTQSELKARKQSERLGRRLLDEDRAWRQRMVARTRAAEESALLLELKPEERNDARCVADVSHRLGRWLELRELGHFQSIDALSSWRPMRLLRPSHDHARRRGR